MRVDPITFEVVNNALGLLDSSIQRLNARPEQGLDQRLVLDLDGELTEVVLSGHTVRAANYKVYENPEPGDADDQAQLEPLVRSNSIKYWKKAISYFMPNRLQPWNVLSNSGNPTRCTDINDLIKRILRREVRGQCVQSCGTDSS